MESYSRRVTAGAVQGSILGPELWNISYDDILRIELSNSCCLVGYTDDIAILITERRLEVIQERVGLVIFRIRTKLDDHGLELTDEKTHNPPD